MTTKEQILDFIVNHREKHGYAPSQSEIARELNVTRQNIWRHFGDLKDELIKYPEYLRLFNEKKEE